MNGQPWGCAVCFTAVGDGVSLDSGKGGFPELGCPNRKIRFILIRYNSLKPSPGLAFTCEQLSSMIPKDFST